MRLRYLHAFKDRQGRWRYYFRRHGIRKPLSGDPGTPEFLEAYHRALVGTSTPPTSITRGMPSPGSMASIIQAYKSSLQFRQNSPRTQHVTRLILDRFAAVHGHRLVKDLQRKHVQKILADMASRPAAANDLLKKLRRLIAFARELGIRADDPCAGIRPFKSGTHHTWTDDQIAHFERTWPLGTTERTAFALHLWTAQRSQDVRRMTWADVSNGIVRVTQGKTGQKLEIPIHPALAAALASYPPRHHIILATQFGKAFSEKGYGQWFAKAISRAGLPDECVTHGLRKAGARRLAEGGASANEIAAVTGHRTLKEVARYTAAADQRRLATSAIARISEQSGTQTGKPYEEVCQKPEKRE